MEGYVSKVLYNNQHVIMSVFLITTLPFFAYIWGIWGWNRAPLWSSWWWFDTGGHTIFGFLAGLFFMYLVRTLAFKYRVFRVLLLKYFLQVAIVLLIVLLAAVGWELYESLQDSLNEGVPGYIVAQSSGKDTTIDIAVAILGYCVAMIVYYQIVCHYRKYDDIQLAEAIETLKEIDETIAALYAGKNKSIQKAIKNHLKRRRRSFGRRIA